MRDSPSVFSEDSGLREPVLSETNKGHVPVLVGPVLDLLGVRAGETVADVTVGAGGHARLFAEHLGERGRLIGLDRDPESLALARSVLADAVCPVDLLAADFADVDVVLAGQGVDRVDVMFADLGVSSIQLDQADRGFSFARPGPLDMRLGPDTPTTAADLVNGLGEKALADLFYENAQERASRRIAKRICQVRREERITTTDRLAAIVASALGVNPASRRSRIHPATRVFLALRMAVNDELGALERFLATAPGLLAVGGRIGVISFHSTEDRIVKRDFRRRQSEGVYRIVTKKPVVATEDERRSNPRSRSAKLRVAVLDRRE